MSAWMAQLLTFQLYAPHAGLLLVWAMKSSGMVFFAWGVATVLRRRSAAARCWMWRACLAGILGLVVFEFGPAFLKRARPMVAVEPSAESSESFKAAARVVHFLRSEEEIQRLTTPREIGAGEGAAQARPPWQRRAYESLQITWSDLLGPWWSVMEKALPWLWAGGAALILVIQITRTILGRAWLRRSSRPAAGRMREIGERCARDTGLRWVPRVSLSARLRSPLLVGFFRPVVYLPEAAGEWADTKLVSVFLHEMAHARRGDFAWLQAGRLAGALFWWNPLVWWAARQMNAESEEAADDAVVLGQAGGEAYARALVEIASADPVAETSLGVSMLGYKSLEKRIQALLKENPWRGRVGKAAGWMLLAAMLGLVAVGGLYVGLPAARAKAEVPPSERLSEAQGKMVERIIANTKKRLTAQRFTHVKVESMITVEAGGIVKTSPLPSKLEAWNDTWTNQYRAEYRPQVSRWTNGAAPFYVRDNTQICNGKDTYSYESGDDLNRLRAWKGPEALYAPYLNVSNATQMINVLENLLRLKIFKTSSMTLILSETTWEGEPAVKIEERISPDDTATQFTSYIVVPGKEDFLVASEFGSSKRPAPVSQWTVEAVSRTADGSYYPKKFKDVFHSDQSKTTETYTVTSFEKLTELPPRVLDLPRNPDDLYVAKNDRPVRREALALECVNEKTGRPMAGVDVEVCVNRMKKVFFQTDAAGRVSIPLPKEEITYFSAQASPAGFAPRVVEWRKYGDPLQLPEGYQLKLFPASPIAGRVVDSEGKPIAGAEVEMYLSGGPRSYSVFSDRFALGVTTKTDANGQWSFANFPEALDGLFYRVSRAGYQATTDMGIADFLTYSGQPYSALRDGSSVIVLQRGAELRGVITDQGGRPVPHCHISMGKDRYGSNLPETESDATGRYALTGLEAGKKLVTFEAPGLMPVLQEITLPHDQPLDVALAPGRMLRARVTMPDGKPCAGLDVSADRWKNTRMLTFSTQTDADGYFTWNGAPEEEVTFSFGACQSREFLCDLPLKAGDEVRQVVMKPALRFSGQAVDAKTGQSIPGVRVVPGRVVGGARDIYWEKEKAQTFANGTFAWKTDYIGQDYVFQVEAKGYKTFQTEPMNSRQNDVTQTVRLEREQ